MDERFKRCHNCGSKHNISVLTCDCGEELGEDKVIERKPAVCVKGMKYPQSVEGNDTDIVQETPANGANEQSTQQKKTLSPVPSVLLTFLLGVLSICLGIYLTPYIMEAGDYMVKQSSTNLGGIAGVISACFGPILPYVLISFVVVGMKESSSSIRPIMLTAVALIILTFSYHLYSPMLQQLGDRLKLKWLFKAPACMAILYLIIGLIAMLIICGGSPGVQKRNNGE